MSIINKKEFSTPPPVPPRRRKRKNELVLKTSSKGALVPESSRKSEHKLRLPPPPPPPTTNSRGTKTPLVGNCSSRSITSDKPEADNVPTGCEDATSCTNFHEGETANYTPADLCTSDPINDKDDLYLARDSTDSLEPTKDNRIKEPKIPRERPRCLSNKKADNKYPSLFFTLQDFENVMANSVSNVNEKIVDDNSQERSEVKFLGHSLDGDNGEEICFRITTTNVPFEKCLGRWDSGNFENKHFGTDIQSDDHFVFEDYIDRTKRTGRIKQSESFLFADDTFENNDVDSMSTDRSATKVRFVVDSPSSSTPDGESNEEEKITSDSLLNIDSILADDFESKDEPVTLTENTDIEIKENIFNESLESPKPDEFGEIPFSSLLSTNGVDVNNAFSAVNNNINLNCDALGFNDYPESPESTYRVFTVTACIEILPNNYSKQVVEANKNIFPSINENHASDCTRDIVKEDVLTETHDTKGFPEKGLIENEKSVLHVNVPEPKYFVQDKKKFLKECHVTAEKERITVVDIPQGESKEREVRLEESLSLVKNNTPAIKMVEKRKIFIDESLHDLINNEDDMEWRDSSDEEEMKVKTDKIEFSIKQAAHPKEDYNENMEKSSRLESPVDIQKVECLSTTNNDITNEKDLKAEKFINEKVVPVSIRRNSFLEDMLNDDILHASCKIIATHPKIPNRSSLTHEIPKKVISTKNVTSPGISNNLKKNPGLPTVNKEKKYSVVQNYQEEMKSSCEIKSDVLSELLCNFNAIKLKSIGDNEAKVSTGMTNNKTEGLKTRSDSTPKDIKDPHVDSNNIKSNVVKSKIIEELIVDTRSRDKSHDGDAASSEKTDEIIDKCANSSARAKGPEVPVSTVDIDTINRIDECAIARKAPLTQCNNTDNNAMTPVAVSSDQSRDVVSITPGSVRSFVKYYEIQRETSKHSKSNDSEPVARRFTMYRMEMEKGIKNGECEQRKIERKKILEDKAHYSGIEVSMDHDKKNNNQSVCDSTTVKEIDNDIRYTVITRKIVRKDANSLSLKSNSDLHRSAGNIIGKGSCFKMADPLKSEYKKTVQFDSGCTVIQLNDYDEVLEDPNKVEWMRSEMKMMKEPVQKDPHKAGSITVRGELFRSSVELEEETDRLMSHPVDGNSLQIEKLTGIEAEDGTRKSGMARLVPKSTNHLNQTHVFYCTV